MRINIKEDSVRKHFFNLVKEKNNGLWKNVRINHNIPRATFDKYKNGALMIPDKLFYAILDNFNKNEKSIFESKIEVLKDNFGQIKGGKTAYQKNKKYFDNGRNKKGGTIIDYSKFISNLSLNNNLCEVIGAFIGDGNFNFYKNKLYHIEFSGDTRYDLLYYKEVIIPTIQTIIPEINPHFKMEDSNKGNTLRVIFYSKKLFIFLRDFCGFVPGKKTFTVNIPLKVINSNDNSYIYSTIRGIFDTDGGVFLDRRRIYKNIYPRIFIQTVSKPLYDQLLFYLSKEFKLYTRFNPKRQVYIIEIYTMNQIRKWISLIGFSNKRHLTKIEQLPQ